MVTPRKASTPIAVRRAERELFFWTARQSLKLLVLAALAIYTIVSLVQGEIPGSWLLRQLL